MTVPSINNVVSSNSSTLSTSSTTNPTSSSSALTSAVNSSSLGENSFLQLLVTQMQHQDPTQPQSNTQFIAQLAQFTSLEQMTNVSNSSAQMVSELNALTSNTQLNSAFLLLGDTVTVQSSDGASVTGPVTSVNANGSTTTVTVNGTDYPVSSVMSVSK